MDVCIVSTSWLLRTTLQQKWESRYLCDILISFSLDTYTKVKLLDHMIVLNFLRKLLNVFHNSYILHSQYSVQGLQCLHNFKYVILSLFHNSHPKKVMISHCNFDWHFHDDY